jgi:predicted Zn-dependent protease
MRALDELLNSWRSNPDADATIAVCSYLGSSKRDELIREVGASAETWHAANAAVMLAVGRMYLDASLLQEAQTALVAAGKADARDARPFRFLGEVLLRRGDAVRGEKVLARALQLSGADDDAELWHERAVLFSALQKRVGPEAVAAEVARSMPRQVSVPPPPGSDPLPSFGLEESTRPRNEPLPAARVARKATLLGLADANPLPRFGSAPGQESADPIQVSESDLLDTPTGDLPPGRTQVPASAKPGPRQQVAASGAKPGVTLNKPNLKATQVGGFQANAAPPAAKPAPFIGKPSLARPIPKRLELDDAVTVITPPPFNAPPILDSVPPPPAPVPMSPAPPLVAPFRSAPPVFSREAETMPPFGAFAAPPASSAPVTDPAHPSPAVVMEHLARVGLYEPGGGAAPAWENPPRQKSRGPVAMLIATLVLAAAGGGVYAYSRKVKAERAQEAETLNAQVDKLLKTGSPTELRATDDRLTRSFELDSRSQRAGRLWLQNRVLSALLLPGETRGIDAAVYRGRQVGLPEKDLLVGKVASFLVEGDVAGGAALLVAGDKSSGTDPYYQLAAGAVLERAGDSRALERYAAAVQLAPELVPARLLQARLLLLEGGPDAARSLLDSLRQRTGDTPVSRALSALSWVLAPNRPEEPPAEAQLAAGDAENLPAPLAAVPAMVLAARALNKGELRAASQSIDAAIGLAMTPALAASLGFLAIEAGDEVVARKAALRALQFSGVYPKARTLAARVALLGGRIDEAQKAIEGLDPTSSDVAVVRAVVAYESLESADLRSALESLGNKAVGSAFSALEAAAGVINGTAFPPAASLEELAGPEKPWGELVSVDAAIETGNLAFAEKQLAQRSVETLRPVHLRRLARLRRLQGKLDDALQASSASAEGGMALPLLLERVYELLAKEDVAGAKQLAAKYPSLLGPLAGWVGVLTDLASKQAAAAAVRLTKLDLPPDESPIAVRVLVARALASAGDKRAKPYVAVQLKKLPKNPDILAAAALL